MLFARSLRRKLMLGVALVLGMLVILSVSGILGLNSYRNVIRDLEHVIYHAPQRDELRDAVASLFEPLLIEIHSDRDAREQAEAFGRQLASVRATVDEYRRRTEELPPAKGPASQRPLTDSLMFDIDQRLDRLNASCRRLAVEKENREFLPQVTYEVALLLTTARGVPDPAQGLKRNLDLAKGAYRSSLVAVWVSSSVVVVLFLGLLRCGYVWVFHPIRQLHQGALRVANGDFDYRVQLKTRDEMAELAAAFNQMTARFQEIAADLDGKVQERSRQLVRSERLAGVGFLAAGVAHEINNPLSAIAMAAESLEDRIAGLLDRLEPGDAKVVRQYLGMIQSESFRCKNITERLLDFSRGRDAVREPTDLAHLVSEVVSMVQYLGKYREKKIEFTPASPCFAEVNGPEIKQVVLNLVANGLDAMERGGTLRIELVEETDHVCLAFHDDGCGMTADVMENMFEPFFTSKQNGQGTGLGLSISHRIVSQHGGTISARSAGPNQGSTFLVRIPRRAVHGKAAA